MTGRARLLLQLAGLLMAGAALALPGPAGPRPACAAGTHRAAVVVEHGNGSVYTACVGFDSSSLGGIGLMQASGISYATSAYGGLGAAVCQVDGEPASFPPGCWTATSPYWALFVSRSGGPWALSAQGLSGVTVADGDAIGWRYVGQGGSPPPPPSPAGACPPAAALTRSPATASTPPAAPGSTSTPVAPPVSPSPSSTPSIAGEAVPATPSAQPGRGGGGEAPTAGGGVSAGWLAAAALGGGLAGLLVLQLARRR